MKFEKNNLSESFLIELYNSLLLPRLIEEKMLNLLRQGKISKWFSGIGQEAISVGCTKALMKDEFILPMHRNLGVFTGRGLELSKLFSQFQGKENGFSKGRERSFHFGSNEHNIFGMISHLGPQLGVADGIALWHKIKKEKKCTLVFTGDGGTSEGDFHEALNVAAVWDLPVIFLIENNGYGLSTPTSEQYRCRKLIDKGAGYGIEAIQIEGNNVLEVYNIITKYAKEIRKNPRPVLIEALTFRMRGHEEASGTKYIPKKYFEEWGKKDPILNYEKFLIEEKLIDNSFVKETKDEIKTLIDNEWEISVNEPDIIPDTEKETRDVYFPYKHVPANIGESKTKKRFVNAITEALAESMSKFPELIIMGQDVADYGGVKK